MKAEYALPSNVYNEVKIDNPNDKFSFFEIEVNRINFITDKSIKASPPSTSSLSLSPSPSLPVSLYGNDKSPGQPKASSLSQHQSAGVLSGVVVGGIGAVTAKIICWGEQWEAAAAAAAVASVSISCGAAACSSSSKGSNGIKKLCAGRHQIQKQSSSQQQQQHQVETRKKHQLLRRRRSTRQPHPLQKQHNLHHQHNKLRYCLRSKSLALFLEYLRECPSIEIVANSSSSSSDHAYDQKSSPTEASGAARLPLPLPAPLLQRSKYAAKNNVTVDCNFVQDKTKIYALYRHVASRGTSSQVQQQQQLKIAEFFKLRFNMLFAAAATASANKTVRIGAAATVPPPLPLPPPTAATPLPAALLQDHKLTITSLSSQSQPGEHIAGTAPAPATVAAPAKQVELMEAMKKLDADLVALFAATAAAEPKMEKLKQQQQLWREGEEQLELSGAAADELSVVEEQQQLELQLQKEQQQEEEQATTPELFKLVNLLQLHLEALTLQPEGTKRMELLQSEVRPIFTVECQLSDELIRSVPRAPMFHIMQFESEKFQSLTQCTRFGQTQQRQVHMSQAAQEKEQEQEQENMGFIQFTIWWREPGTCLNELLGMGRLPLAELYRASLLEQCKCITIQRRDLHLASLYLKISLRSDQQLMFPQLSVPNSNNISNNSCNNNNNNSSSSSNNHNNNNKSYHSGAAAANNNNYNINSRAASTQTSTPSAKTNSNNKASLESVHFMAETTKVRLLRGYIYAGETRHLSPTDASSCKELVLQPFWQPHELIVPMSAQGAFKLQEQFAIINDEKFLQSVERQQLQLQLRPLGGQVQLPLHQFYIAYRDASITNHLCKGKLPVISIDGWTPILHAETQVQLGELKVLLAIGSESQIAQLKLQRGLDVDNNPQQQQQQPQSPLRSTTDLLDMLQNALSASPAPSTATTVPAAPAVLPPTTDSPFSFSLQIVGAAGLPLNPGYGKSGKKQAKRQAAAKRFPPNEPPNTYVTFQALNCNAQTYKSHEGLVYATSIVERSTTPQWHSKFQVEVSSDYLCNPQKLFILKLWKKTALSAGTSTEPTPLEDAIIGFAALNLNKKHNVHSFPTGWHNIVDFNGRVTGGLEIHVQPLPPAAVPSAGNVDTAIDQFEQTLELRHLQLGQAIKRKFTELEQISNRLRTRLVDVTGETLQSPQFDVDAALDNWQPDEVQQWHEDDELAADFERALRTPTPPPSATSAQNESQADASKE